MSTSTTHGFSKEELDLLTEEELAGLTDPDLVDDPVPGSPEANSAAAEAEAETAGPEAVAAATAEEAAALQQDAEAASSASSAEDAAPAATPAPRVPNYEAPADLEDQMKSVRAQQEALADKFDAGELTAREYEAQRRTLEDQYLDLRDTRSRAALSWDAQRTTWENETVADFLKDNSAYAEEGSFLYQALDREVRRLQTTTYKGDLFNPKILADAHDNIQAGLAKLTGGRPTMPTEDPKTPSRQIPPSISHMPTAHEDALDGGGDFAFIDRLTGVEYEEALERLTPQQYDAYMSRA